MPSLLLSSPLVADDDLTPLPWALALADRDGEDDLFFAADENALNAELAGRQYADQCNHLDAAGQQEQAEHLADEASDELYPHGWVVGRAEDGRWEAVSSWSQFAAFAYHDVRAPIGGVNIGGVFYAGGRFIPAGAVASASPDDQAKLVAAQQTAGATKAARVAGRQSRGKVDTAALGERLAPHAAEHKLTDSDRRRAEASARMIHGHHGDLALHRLEELEGGLQKALGGVKDDNQNAEGLREHFGRELAKLHHAAGHLKEKGVTGEVKGEQPDEELTPAPEVPYEELVAARKDYDKAREEQRKGKTGPELDERIKKAQETIRKAQGTSGKKPTADEEEESYQRDLWEKHGGAAKKATSPPPEKKPPPPEPTDEEEAARQRDLWEKHGVGSKAAKEKPAPSEPAPEPSPSSLTSQPDEETTPASEPAEELTPASAPSAEDAYVSSDHAVQLAQSQLEFRTAQIHGTIKGPQRDRHENIAKEAKRQLELAQDHARKEHQMIEASRATGKKEVPKPSTSAPSDDLTPARTQPPATPPAATPREPTAKAPAAGPAAASFPPASKPTAPPPAPSLTSTHPTARPRYQGEDLNKYAAGHGFLPNKFAGYSGGKKIAAGQGFVKRDESGKWKTYTRAEIEKQFPEQKDEADFAEELTPATI